MYRDFVNQTELWYEYVYHTLNDSMNYVRTNQTGGAKRATFYMLALCKDDPNAHAAIFTASFSLSILAIIMLFLK